MKWKFIGEEIIKQKKTKKKRFTNNTTNVHEKYEINVKMR